MQTLRKQEPTRLPHETDVQFLMDGGLETTLIFEHGLDLPYFAAFPLIDSSEGREILHGYFKGYLDIAAEHGTGFVLETPTWRASSDWGDLLGYEGEKIADANRRTVAFLREIRDQNAHRCEIALSGCIGPRGDGYVVGTEMTIGEAREYHAQQIGALAEAGVEMLTALTMTYTEEAVGIALAARDVGLPIAIAFTVETDGRLPNGVALHEAIIAVDAATDGSPAYFMINCAHPTHFQHVLDSDAEWISRIRGIRANASCRSHAELDEAEDLDDGNPVELGDQYAVLRSMIPNLNVAGGCCGTDHRHVGEIARNLCSVRQAG